MKRTVVVAAFAAFAAFSFLTIACCRPPQSSEPVERQRSPLSFTIRRNSHDIVDSVSCAGVPYIVETSPDTSVDPQSVQMRDTDFLATQFPSSNAMSIACAMGPLKSNGVVFYNDQPTSCEMKSRRAGGTLTHLITWAVPATDMQYIPYDSPVCPQPGNPDGVWRLLMPNPDCSGTWTVKQWTF